MNSRISSSVLCVTLADAGDRGHDLTRGAEAALEGVVFNEGCLHGMQSAAVGQTFDRRDLAAFRHDGEREAGQDAPSIDMDGARTAFAAVAALLRAGQLDALSQGIDQGGADIEFKLMGSTIDPEICGDRGISRCLGSTRLLEAEHWGGNDNEGCRRGAEFQQFAPVDFGRTHADFLGIATILLLVLGCFPVGPGFWPKHHTVDRARLCIERSCHCRLHRRFDPDFTNLILTRSSPANRLAEHLSALPATEAPWRRDERHHVTRGRELDLMSSVSSTFLARRPAELPDVELFRGMSVEPSPVRHLHEDFRFGVALGGKWSTRYRGANLLVGPGQIQLAQPGEISSCEFASRERQSFCGMTISITRVAEVNADAHGLRHGSPFFPEHLVTDKKAEAFFVETHQRLMQPASALESSSLLQHLILLLLRRFAGKRPEIPALKDAPRAVRIARDYIEDRLSANPSLDDLSAVAGMSPFHLSRLFRRSMGLPPHAYQNHLRVQKAKALLAAGQPGDEVAAELGFADQSHFIRQFKRQVGLTPQVYRESIQP